MVGEARRGEASGIVGLDRNGVDVVGGGKVYDRDGFGGGAATGGGFGNGFPRCFGCTGFGCTSFGFAGTGCCTGFGLAAAGLSGTNEGWFGLGWAVVSG
jgi:hypothetical protein